MKNNHQVLTTPWLPLISALVLATFCLGACSDDQGTCEGGSCTSGDGDGDGGAQGDGDEGNGGKRDTGDGDGDGDDDPDETTNGEGGASSEEDDTSSGDGDGDDEGDGECRSGTWDHDEDPDTKCKAWTTCEAGEWVTEEGTSASDRACEPCALGTFSAEENAGKCVEWSQCSSGVRTSGSSKSDVACEAAITDLQVGDGFSCVLREDGTVWCWGRNDLGQLGRGDRLSSPLSQPVMVNSQRGLEPLHDVAQLSVGKDAACVTRHSGNGENVWCWGSNATGQVSLRDELAGDVVDLAQKMEGVEAATRVEIGQTHACAVLPLGRVTCWGAAGRLFKHRGETDCWGTVGEEKTCEGVSLTFEHVDTTLGIARVTYVDYQDAEDHPLLMDGAINLVVGSSLACAGRDDGRTTCWRGWFPPEDYAFEMEDIAVLTNVVSSSSAASRTCWLKQNNEVYCAREVHKEAPLLVDFREVVVPSGLKVVEVEARASGMCLLSDSGLILCQTANGDGSLPTSAPVETTSLQDIIAIDGSYEQLCALDGEGRVYCDESGVMVEHQF